MKKLTPLTLLLVAVCANTERYPEGYADDRAAIVDLQSRYVMAMDYFDADGYAAVFGALQSTGTPRAAATNVS